MFTVQALDCKSVILLFGLFWIWIILFLAAPCVLASMGIGGLSFVDTYDDMIANAWPLCLIAWPLPGTVALVSDVSCIWGLFFVDTYSLQNANLAVAVNLMPDCDCLIANLWGPLFCRMLIT